MQKTTIKVGVKTPFEFQVVCEYDEAENMNDVRKLTTDEQYLVTCFVRADRIFAVEKTDARKVVARSLRNLRAEFKNIKSASDLSAEQVAKIQRLAQAELDKFARTSERGARKTVLNMTQQMYDSLDEATKASMTAQNIVFNIVDSVDALLELNKKEGLMNKVETASK